VLVGWRCRRWRVSFSPHRERRVVFPQRRAGRYARAMGKGRAHRHGSRQWLRVLRRLLLCLCLQLPQCALAADSVEVLQARAESASGNAQVDAYNDLAKAYWGISIDKSLEFAGRALQQARQRNYAAGEAAALRNE